MSQAAVQLGWAQEAGPGPARSSPPGHPGTLIHITEMCANPGWETAICMDKTGKQDFQGFSQCHTSGRMGLSKLLDCLQHLCSHPPTCSLLYLIFVSHP